MTPAGTSNELDVQNEWEENTHTPSTFVFHGFHITFNNIEIDCAAFFGARFGMKDPFDVCAHEGFGLGIVFAAYDSTQTF